MMRVEKILLVDDDSITNDINKYLIKRLDTGSEITLLRNGREAMEYLEKADTSETAPLMFLDLNMPVMNGKEFLEEFGTKAGEFKPLPVIVVLSTSTIPQEIREVENYPFVMGRIEKPLTADKLKRVIMAYTEYSANRPDSV